MRVDLILNIVTADQVIQSPRNLPIIIGTSINQYWLCCPYKIVKFSGPRTILCQGTSPTSRPKNARRALENMVKIERKSNGFSRSLHAVLEPDMRHVSRNHVIQVWVL